MRKLFSIFLLSAVLTGCGADWFPAFHVTPVSISTTSLPSATVGTTYSQTLTATGGVTPYSWTVSSGSLPAGLTLSSGTISGTPTTAGSSTFTVEVSDASSPAQTATQSLTITVSLRTIAAGQSSVLTSGQSVLVPVGATVTPSGGTLTTLDGTQNPFTTTAGATVAVPSGITATPTITVTAQ
jgi:hypothetical protein